MTRFERWFIKRVMRREFVQGPAHAKNIENMYGMIRTVCEREFTEDTAPTLDAFLAERFESTQRTPYYKDGLEAEREKVTELRAKLMDALGITEEELVQHLGDGGQGHVR